MTESTFDPALLKSLIPDVTQSKFSSLSHIYKNICNYCGVDWERRCIRIPAESFYESLNPDQVKSLRTFQGNLMHFFEHFDAIINQSFIGFNVTNSIFVKRIRKDLDERAIKVFIKMTHNLIDQLNQHDNNPQTRESSSNDVIIDNLCDGDLEKTLKLVPSRELARQLGISDQKLRREIYLARQRALKKRSHSQQYSNDDNFEIRITKFGDLILDSINNTNIPTCASPLSSTSNDSSRNVLSDFELENSNQFELIESPLEGWHSWLNIDMIEL